MAEYRTYDEVSIRSEDMEDGKMRFSGYIAKFNEDSKELSQGRAKFTERLKPGCFKRALERDDIKMLVNHDKARVLGRNGIPDGEVGALSLSEDDVGLRFDVTATDTSYARDLYENVKAGVINSCSFGFRNPTYKNSRGSDGKILREMQDCELFDVSIVTYPAYNSTTAQARSLEDIYEELREELGDGQETPEGEGESGEATRTTPPVSLLKKQLELKEKE